MVLHYRSLEPVALSHAWVTIGSYDGVHLGHQQILRGMTAGAHAQGALAVVVTFHPHPRQVLRGEQGPFYLTLPDERAEILGGLGVDVVITHPFDAQVAAMPAEGFVQALKSHLDLRQLWVGHDFALGRGRQGDATFLRTLGEQMGYQVQVTDPVVLDGQVVSSSQVRQALSEGQVEKALALLGRAYRLEGQVVSGDGRGRTIGIPTANLAVPEGKLIPAGGVYACRAWVGSSQAYTAAVNIGSRPTFDGAPGVLHVEAHLIDGSGDLYGQSMRLEFYARLRGEKRFPNTQALINQIHQDIDRTRQLVSLAKG